MYEVEEFILKHQGNTRLILDHLHQMITGYPNVTAKIRYKIPFYYRKSWICYLNPQKNDTVEFAFPRGSELADEGTILEAKDRKQVRSITFDNLEQINTAAVDLVLNEAFILDDHVAYASKRTLKK